MKNFIFILLLLPLVALAQKQPVFTAYDFQITRVIDGDTIAFRATFLPPPLKQELSVRIYGVDTPEKGYRAKCPQEEANGKLATQFTTQFIKNGKIKQIVIIAWDKYGGRVLGDVLVDGVSLRTSLIQQGLAREYYGAAKTSWCK